MDAPCRYGGHRLREGRRSERGRTYLLTTVTRDREPVLARWDAARACARVLHDVPGQVSAANLAWVVMPDHVHWLVTLGEADLGTAMGRFKSLSARAIRRAIGGSGPVWQRGYHDHAVRREEDLRAIARYVIANPLRARLCERVGDYPFWDAAWLGG